MAMMSTQGRTLLSSAIQLRRVVGYVGITSLQQEVLVLYTYIPWVLEYSGIRLISIFVAKRDTDFSLLLVEKGCCHGYLWESIWFSYLMLCSEILITLVNESERLYSSQQIYGSSS